MHNDFPSARLLSRFLFIIYSIRKAYAQNSTLSSGLNQTISPPPTTPLTSAPSQSSLSIFDPTPSVPSISETNVTNAPSLTPVVIENVADELSCREPDPTKFYYCPTQRYCDWNGQSADAKSWLTNRLSYENLTWNYYDINPIEMSWFEDLSVTQQSSLTDIGFDVDIHDCCLSHYSLYGWGGFDRWGMTDEKAAWETVGYDEDKWNNGEDLDNFDLAWDDLAEDVRFALEFNLCYNEELWNEIPMENWPDDVVLPGTYEMETDAPTGLSSDPPTGSPADPPADPTEPPSPMSIGFMPTMNFTVFLIFVVSCVALFV